MAQDTALQVIELQQLPIIVERLHSVKAEIERRTAEATSLICTEETYKSVKDARAQLTKEFKEYEAQRTAIKSKILEPYNAFEQVYRECVTAPFQQADAELKQKIADVTSGIVAQKTEALMDYYGELVEAADIDWLDNLTYRPKVNMSDSLTSLKKQAKAFVDGIVADVAAIEGMDNAAEIMVEYRSNLDLPNAMCYIQLSFLGCAGYVVIGNTITEPSTAYDRRGLLPAGPQSRIWYTPFFSTDIWFLRRQWAQIELLMKPVCRQTEQAEPEHKKDDAAPPLCETKTGQLTFF